MKVLVDKNSMMI